MTNRCTRALKGFCSEELPRKRFAANAALYYYMQLVAFFLMEAFKEDVGRGVIGLSSYAMRLRRRLVDIPAKIVRTATNASSSLNVLWERASSPPRFTCR